jgi:hypothetical protein
LSALRTDGSSLEFARLEVAGEQAAAFDVSCREGGVSYVSPGQRPVLDVAARDRQRPYEVPPSETNSASVAVTLAYEKR